MGSEHIPELGTVVVRHRLLHLLEENRSKRISIVTGPPGYGKSTLVAQFAHELETPVFWFRLDNRDRDMSWLRQRLTQQLPDLRSTESSSAAELATDLADVLLKEAAPRLVCVFDDVQAVMAPGPAGDWLRKLVDLLPQNVHLILISRAMPELPYASLLAKDDLAVLGIDELRLTPEEAHDLAREVGEDLSLSDIRQIVQRLEGWPAGVAIALRQRLNSGLLGGLASPEGTFD
ncbi:MAG: AAA family ATPase, partial [Chloroflexi bacterium]|nr:AAA family ATPase [Chloroflexota bacterium]